MDKLKSFFTPERRKAIYRIVGVCAAGLVVFNVVSQDQLNQVVQNVGGVIVILTSLMAALNVNGKPEDEPADEGDVPQS